LQWFHYKGNPLLGVPVDALDSKVIASGEDEEVSTFAPVKAYLKTLAQGAENFNKVKLMFVGVCCLFQSSSPIPRTC